MDTAHEHRIRLRAYEIWLTAGMGEGNAELHWLHAERDVGDESETPRAGKGDVVDWPTHKTAAPKSAKAKTVKAETGSAKTSKAETSKAKISKAETGAPKIAARASTVPRRPKAAVGSAADAVT